MLKHIDCSSKKEVVIGAAMFSNTEKFLKKQYHRSDAQPVNELKKIHENRTELHPLSDRIPATIFSKFLQFHRKNDNERRASLPKVNKQQIVEGKFTWWTKFYNSLNGGLDGGIEKHRLRIFDCELEKIDEFSNLTDWAERMTLLKGTNSKKISGPKFETYGILKCNIRVIKTSEGDNSKAIDMKGNRY